MRTTIVHMLLSRSFHIIWLHWAHRVTTILHQLSAERIKFITEFEDYEVAMRSVDADGSFIPRALSSLIEISMDELHELVGIDRWWMLHLWNHMSGSMYRFQAFRECRFNSIKKKYIYRLNCLLGLFKIVQIANSIRVSEIETDDSQNFIWQLIWNLLNSQKFIRLHAQYEVSEAQGLNISLTLTRRHNIRRIKHQFIPPSTARRRFCTIRPRTFSILSQSRAREELIS